MPNKVFLKLKKDRYYFLAGFVLIILITLLFLFRENFISAVDVHLTSLKIFGNYYDLNLFDGIMFTSFIIITMVTAWYFGGHAAFMFVSISWNFEVALFIVLTGRYELIVEFVNLFVFVALYFIESPADKKARVQRQLVEQSNIKLKKINKAFERFVPKEFIHLIGKESVIELSTGDSKQEVLTVLFTDIRDFSDFAYNKCPKEVFDFLNSFLREIGPVIRKHNGFIDKYLGDGVMALFPTCPSDALSCAMEMSQVLNEFNKKNEKTNIETIRIGTGIHTGTSILGTLGEEERIETTVISESVNLSCRLEELTKKYGVEIIVSQKLLDEIDDYSHFPLRFLDEVSIKGLGAKHKIFELLPDKTSAISLLKIKHKEDFEKAVNLMRDEQYTDAIAIFERLSKACPQDKAVMHHLNRCREFKVAI